MLLDGGSQHSYMTERARRMLNLDPDGEQQLSIATFCSARGGPKVCPIISVGVILKGYPSLNMSLFIVPTIFESLIGQPIDVCIEQNPHLSGAVQGSKLELIGAEDLVTGAVYKNKGGPTANQVGLGIVWSDSRWNLEIMFGYDPRAQSRYPK